MRVDVRNLVQQLRQKKRELAAFRQWVKSLERAVEVSYEELLDADGIGLDIKRRLGDKLGVEVPDKLSSPYIKMIPRVQDVIENCEEVVETLRDTEFFGCLQDDDRGSDVVFGKHGQDGSQSGG